MGSSLLTRTVSKCHRRTKNIIEKTWTLAATNVYPTRAAIVAASKEHSLHLSESHGNVERVPLHKNMQNRKRVAQDAQIFVKSGEI